MSKTKVVKFQAMNWWKEAKKDNWRLTILDISYFDYDAGVADFDIIILNFIFRWSIITKWER